MRVLLTSTSGEGHAGQLLPFAESLRRAGGKVVFATRGPAAAAARSADFEVLDVAGAPPDLREPWFDQGRREPEGNVNSHVLRHVFAGVDAQAALPGVLAACRSWRPDVLVHESCEFAAVLAADLCGMPRVRVAIGTAVTERVILTAVAGPLAARRAEVGLPPTAKDAQRLVAPSLTLAPAVLEDNSVPELDGSRRFRVPTPVLRPLPDWWPGDARPLVYVTFGTVAPRSELFPGLHRTAALAIGGLPVRVLVTVGRDVDPAALGPLPANVHACGWVRQPDAIARAAVVACHAGSGTCREALAAGVPLAVLPLFADQPHNADRIAALGVGVAVQGGPQAAASLSDAVRRVLGDPHYAEAAARAAEEIRRWPTTDEAVGYLGRVISVVRPISSSR